MDCCLLAYTPDNIQTTVGNELKRGTPPRKSNKGRNPRYSAMCGETVYKANRKRSRKPHRICHCTRFIRWIIEQVKEHKWSLDACVGYARLHELFPADEMVCTHTLYNEVWAGNLGRAACQSKAVPENVLEKFAADIAPGKITAVRAENGNRLVFTLADGSEIVKQWEDRSRAESWTLEMKEAARQKALRQNHS